MDDETEESTERQGYAKIPRKSPHEATAEEEIEGVRGMVESPAKR